MAEEGRVGAMMTRVRTRVGRKRTSLVRASHGIQEPEINKDEDSGEEEQQELRRAVAQ